MTLMSKLGGALLIASLATAPALARDWRYVTTNARGVVVAVATASYASTRPRISGVFRFRDRKSEWHNLSQPDDRVGARYRACRSTAAAGYRVPPSDPE